MASAGAGPLEAALHFLQAVPLTLPFSVLVGATILARTPPRSMRSALGLLALAAGLTFFTAAVAAPRVEFAVAARQTVGGAGTRFPFGPDTPANLARLATFIREHPPERYSFSTDHPFRTPPNWLDYLRQIPGVLAVLTMLNGLLGFSAGLGLRARSARVARWAIWTAGLAAAVGFMVLQGAAGGIVRRDLAVPGGVLAWAPLLPWLVALAILGTRAAMRREGKESAG